MIHEQLSVLPSISLDVFKLLSPGHQEGVLQAKTKEELLHVLDQQLKNSQTVVQGFGMLIAEGDSTISQSDRAWYELGKKTVALVSAEIKKLTAPLS